MDIFTGKTNRDYEDQVLLGISGPVFVYMHGDERGGVGVRCTGRFDQYRPYSEAAERLVKDGLLTREFDGSPIHYYKFTERGKVAHWAMREAFLK